MIWNHQFSICFALFFLRLIWIKLFSFSSSQGTSYFRHCIFILILVVSLHSLMSVFYLLIIQIFYAVIIFTVDTQWTKPNRYMLFLLWDFWMQTYFWNNISKFVKYLPILWYSNVRLTWTNNCISIDLIHPGLSDVRVWGFLMNINVEKWLRRK